MIEENSTATRATDTIGSIAAFAKRDRSVISHGTWLSLTNPMAADCAYHVSPRPDGSQFLRGAL